MKRSCLAVLTALLAVAGSARAGDDTKPAPAAPAAPATAPKHENKISAEAKAAFERMEKIGNNPVRQGLKEASGAIGMEMMGMAMSMKFTFAAPSTIKVEPDPNAEGPMKMMGTQMANGMARTLKAMLGIFRPADDEEYDASLATKDGKEILSITTYTDNVEQGKSDFTLDANGLIASGTAKTQMEMNGEKHEMTIDTTFTHAKVGDVYRLEKMEMAMTGGAGGGRGMGGGGGMGGGKMTVSLTYTEIDKIAIATSWRTEMAGGQMAFESKISDLVVNGKKVEIKEPEPAKKPAHKMGKGKKDEGGEDDGDDDEGGEKPEKPEKGGK